ncbi:hypothetical protein BD779DRAFT_1099393 [Infundibulicybe gibba]|nr:hypothetical protein BD779DRAFT_1099393 [Infundibulicybe gibba]
MIAASAGISKRTYGVDDLKKSSPCSRQIMLEPAALIACSFLGILSRPLLNPTLLRLKLYRARCRTGSSLLVTLLKHSMCDERRKYCMLQIDPSYTTTTIETKQVGIHLQQNRNNARIDASLFANVGIKNK